MELSRRHLCFLLAHVHTEKRLRGQIKYKNFACVLPNQSCITCAKLSINMITMGNMLQTEMNEINVQALIGAFIRHGNSLTKH